MTDNPADRVKARLDGGRRWIKGDLHTEHGHCLLGATAIVLYGDNDLGAWARLRNTLGDVVAEQYPDRLKPYKGNDVAAFNDHPATTWADVETVLDKAAVRYDEQVRP